jgi:hypothetical protein
MAVSATREVQSNPTTTWIWLYACHARSRAEGADKQRAPKQFSENSCPRPRPVRGLCERSVTGDSGFRPSRNLAGRLRRQVLPGPPFYPPDVRLVMDLTGSVAGAAASDHSRNTASSEPNVTVLPSTRGWRDVILAPLT